MNDVTGCMTNTLICLYVLCISESVQEEDSVISCTWSLYPENWGENCTEDQGKQKRGMATF